VEYDYERVRRELGIEAALEAATRDVRALAAQNRRLRAQLNACAQRLATCEDRLAAAAATQVAQRAEIERLVLSRNDWQQAAQLWESNARSLLEELKLLRGLRQEPPRRP
jgi:cell division septum initiation protein DivIVA